jgi:hypothetical protein
MMGKLRAMVLKTHTSVSLLIMQGYIYMSGYTNEPPDEIFSSPTRKLSSSSSMGYSGEPSNEIFTTPTRKLSSRSGRGSRKLSLLLGFLLFGVLVVGTIEVIFYPFFTQLQSANKPHANQHAMITPTPTLTPTPTPKPFDPNVGAILPTHRIVAFYAIPGAEATGPAYQLTTGMLSDLRAQAAVYQNLDPLHPVQPGIDLVASVPDGFPGPEGTYSHHLDPATIQSYIDFCQQNNLILFLDLDFGLAPVKQELNFFMPYLEHYSFVQLAVDPEWMFPRHDGIPGVNLSNVRASDLNPIIEALAGIPMKYHVPRKVLLLHQYRPDGDGLKDPYNAGVAEIADKRDLLNDSRVDVVVHIDSVGGYKGDQADKTFQYNSWVGQDMQKYQNFRYGGFKMFYHIEAKTLMTPQQVLALKPPPLLITYGN